MHVFPTGFTKPWETPTRVGASVAAAGRVVGRAALRRAGMGLHRARRLRAIFLALIIGMAFARQGNDSRRERRGLPGGAVAYVFLRVVGDALFWTFHPWSPFAVYAGYGCGGGVRRPRRAPRLEQRAAGAEGAPLRAGEPLLLRPHAAPEDPRETERRVLAASARARGASASPT